MCVCVCVCVQLCKLNDSCSFANIMKTRLGSYTINNTSTVETWQTFRPCHMDFFDGRVVWSHDLRVM